MYFIAFELHYFAYRPILFLDECTAGLDPENKHQIWKIVQKLKNPHRCILLTTHSMEECETLCSRIGILVKGRLQCVGSSVHLKKKYGEGYTITVNISKGLNTLVAPEVGLGKEEEVPEVDVMSSAVDTTGDFCPLDEFIVNEIARNHGKRIAIVNNTRKYRIDKDIRTLSEIFTMMESNKAKYNIREWGVSMATLEEVFISAVERAAENERK